MPEDFPVVFQQLKNVIAVYAPPLIVKKETGKEYHLYSTKHIELAGRKYDEIYFAGVIIHKQFVSFYFFPLYTHPHFFADIPTEFKKYLKGKSCFNIKKLDLEILNQVKQLLQKGFDLYKKTKLI